MVQNGNNHITVSIARTGSALRKHTDIYTIISNKKSSAVKRILSEARELKEPTPEFAAYPLDDNIFEWHFTLRGPSGTEFEQGYYHGRIILPVEYPFRPPDVMILTPNGRWELNKKICLTFTGFHEEMWQPAWGIRTALIGVQAFMGARAEAAVGIGSLDYPTEERERLARLSSEWRCPVCQKPNHDTLLSGESRVQEALPDGLTINTSAKRRSEEEQKVESSTTASHDASAGATEPTRANGVETKSTLTNTAIPAVVVQEASFASSQGPSDGMVERVIRSRMEAAQQHQSFNSSLVSTPRSTSPNQPDERAVASDKGKGKEKPGEGTARSLDPASPVASPSSRPTQSNGLRFSSVVDNRPSATPTTSVPRQAQHRHARHPSSAEASARRLAALDRAIVTVICLLAALILRRALNTWT